MGAFGLKGASPAPAIVFYGHSGSGKTVLTIKLIELLTSRGYRVGSIKHHGHNKGFGIDVEGKDSWRQSEAGSRHVTVVSNKRVASYRDVDLGEELTLEEIVEDYTDVDIVIVEGFKKSTLPAMEVIREGNNDPLPEPDGRTIAYVSDRTIEGNTWNGKSVLNLNDVEGVAELICKDDFAVLRSGQ